MVYGLRALKCTGILVCWSRAEFLFVVIEAWKWKQNNGTIVTTGSCICARESTTLGFVFIFISKNRKDQSILGRRYIWIQDLQLFFIVANQNRNHWEDRRKKKSEINSRWHTTTTAADATTAKRIIVNVCTRHSLWWSENVSNCICGCKKTK